MKRRTISILFSLAFSLGILLCGGNFTHSTKTVASPLFSQNGKQYRVVRVIDGDTIVANIHGVQEKVRLIGLNTPETVDPRKPVGCFGKEASDEAKKILTGKSVRLETDPSQSVRDKYGRLLAYVFLEDGTNFNKMMIENGYGYEYTYDVPYIYQSEFKRAETQARKNKTGLWADNVCSKAI